ncbi:Oidioi.mRNA.OKI2018_I69.chr1.g3642.t1.cds [Oikopleura dioica]|uniref:Oidioi.mRNA.OKI2018_I69.chr1.g3642.t1.cds n=1 Tax=Oikopleura dioica TaxID=34765 RepID=A0ABN7SUU2_OIKDI|nr:Oidioi.mRNA.OKI2018_I69.chr1.g3642.t1.cds [Oikopleura dioica]
MLVTFVLNDDVIEHEVLPGDEESLLSYIRRYGNTETKQMCEEGGCGACSIIEIIDDGAQKTRRALSACLITLPKADGRKFVTSSQISKSATGKAIQKSFAENFASQCGYCTPGFVVGATSCTSHEEREVEMNGHICRCTGYFPIKNANKDAPFMDIEDLAELCASCPSRKVVQNQSQHYFTPTSLADLQVLMEMHSSHELIAGHTSKHVSKYYRNTSNEKAPVTIDITKVAEMTAVSIVGSKITIGAVATLEDLRSLFNKSSLKVLNQAGQFLTKVGSISMRHQATWAGSLALQRSVPEFASDISVMLAALGLRLEVLDETNTRKSISVSEFVNDSASNLVINGTIDTTGFESVVDSVTFGKVMDRPTMAAGKLTFGFFSTARLFCSSTAGFRQIESPSTSSTDDLNKSLAGESDLLTRAELLRHYSKLSGTTIAPVSHAQESYSIDDSAQPDIAKGVPQKHAEQLAAGTAEFPSDFEPAVNQLYAKFVSAGKIGNVGSISFEKCRDVKGFVRGITAEDIVNAGFNNTFCYPAGLEPDEINEERVLAYPNIEYHAQPVAIVVAKSQQAADKVAKLVEIEVTGWAHETLQSPVQLSEAIEKKDFFPSGFMSSRDRGDVEEELANPTNHRIEGKLRLPGQYHMFMETHFARANLRDEQVFIDLGSQAVDKVQRNVGHCLNMNHSAITVTCRRMGGGFGGKATRSQWTACAVAIAAKLTKKPVALHLSLEDCITIMGGRSIYEVEYRASFEKKTGKCTAVDCKLYCEAGANYNDSAFNGMLTAMHMESNLGIPNLRFECFAVRTASPAVTWLRAPGMLQASSVLALIVDEGVSGVLPDYLESYKSCLMPKGFMNLMGSVESTDRNVTIIDDICNKVNVEALEKEVDAFNSANKWKKKALAVTGMKYPMDPAFHVNSCLVNICRQDATVQIHVGASDMGQATATRSAQTAARTLGIPLEMVNVQPTSSAVTANGAPTGGTVSTQVACYLISEACKILNASLDPYRPVAPHRDSLDIWRETVKDAAAKGVDLQARFRGSIPNGAYACYGSAVAVVEVDCLNGEHTIEKFDCIYDAGEMLNVGTELGQVEGGLMMGLGWLKMEDLKWDQVSGAKQRGTWEYKVPMHLDIPKKFSCELTNKFLEAEEKRPFPIGSKQAGEAAMLLSFAYRNALQRAVRKFNPHAKMIELPAKTDHVREAINVQADALVL